MTTCPVGRISHVRLNTPPPPPPCARAGDSHCLPPAWRVLDVRGARLLLRPVLATGVKVWHLRDSSTFYPKLDFLQGAKTLPQGATALLLFGEIDCREGIVRAVERGYYAVRCRPEERERAGWGCLTSRPRTRFAQSADDAARSLAEIYVQTLEEVSVKRGIRVIVHPVLPVLDLTRCAGAVTCPRPSSHSRLWPGCAPSPAAATLTGPTCSASMRCCEVLWRPARASCGSPVTRASLTTPARCVDARPVGTRHPRGGGGERGTARRHDGVTMPPPRLAFVQLREDYKLDGTHIHPSYLQSVANCLANMS